MDVAQIREVLHAAMDVRFPRRDPNEPAVAKIEALEDYLTLTAVHRGELESALYWAREAEKVLDDQWYAITGWEAIRDRKRDTDQAVTEAKRTVAPDIYTSLRDVRRMIHDIGRQIRRLEKDFEAVSRDYTLLTGG
jgi:hypothetical protein